MKLRPGYPLTLAIALAACADPSPGDVGQHAETDVVPPETDVAQETDTDPVVVDDTDTDTDTDPVAETASTDLPVETAVPDETDTPDDTGPPVDTSGPLVVPTLSGSFVDLSDPALLDDPLWIDPGDVALRQTPSPTGGTFADLDGDGDMEVVLSTQRTRGVPNPGPQAQVFHWTAGGLVHDEALSATLQAFNDHVLLTADLDDDGFADHVLGRGDGGLVRGGAAGYGPRQPIPLPAGYPLPYSPFGAAAPFDIDGDGWLDLLLGDRDCRPGSATMHILLAEGPGRWRQSTDALAGLENGTPWTVLATSLPDGSSVLGNIGANCDFTAPNPGFVVQDGTDAEGYPTFVARDPTPHLALFHTAYSLTGGPYTLLNPMGAALADFDVDGTLDLALAVDSDMHPLLTRLGTWPMVDATYLEPVRWPTPNLPLFAWSIVPMDVDQDGVPDQITTYGDDPGTFFTAAIGPAVVRALWNDRRGAWHDVGGNLGIELVGNWRSLSAGDPDEDGDLDLVLGGFGTAPRVLRNDVVTGHHGLTLRFRGTTSNHLALGTTVRVIDPDVPRTVHTVGNTFSATVWGAPVLGLGLGDDPTLERLRITWPTGIVQDVTGLTAGQLHELVEPEVLAVDPSTRRVPADGLSTVTFTVDTSVVPGGAQAVDIELFAGTGAWQGPVQIDGTRHSRTLVAADAEGSAVVQVTLDGTPLRIRPRVWWGD